AGALAELVEWQRPFPERGRHAGGVEDPHAVRDRVDDALAVDRVRDGPADAHVTERGLVVPYVEVATDGERELRGPKAGTLLCDLVLERVPVLPIEGSHELRADVVFLREERGHPGGLVLVDNQLDAVDVRQPREEVLWMSCQGHAYVGTIAVEHPGPGADGRLPFLEVAEFDHTLAGNDGPRHRVRHDVGEPDVGLLEDDLH